MFQRAAEQGVNVTQRVVEQGTEATEQGLRIAEEATEQTEEVLLQTEEATREAAELRASVIGALALDDYDGLNVAEVTEKLDELSVEEHERLRGLEKRTEDRESLVKHIVRKIRTNSQGKTLR